MKKGRLHDMRELVKRLRALMAVGDHSFCTVEDEHKEGAKHYVRGCLWLAERELEAKERERERRRKK